MKRSQKWWVTKRKPALTLTIFTVLFQYPAKKSYRLFDLKLANLELGTLHRTNLYNWGMLNYFDDTFLPMFHYTALALSYGLIDPIQTQRTTSFNRTPVFEIADFAKTIAIESPKKRSTK